jgi:hypothetical protein
LNAFLNLGYELLDKKLFEDGAKAKKGNASDTTIVVMMRTVPMMIAGEGM